VIVPYTKLAWFAVGELFAPTQRRLTAYVRRGQLLRRSTCCYCTSYGLVAQCSNNQPAPRRLPLYPRSRLTGSRSGFRCSVYRCRRRSARYAAAAAAAALQMVRSSLAPPFSQASFGLDCVRSRGESYQHKLSAKLCSFDGGR
jgi:hypothetical protein